VLYKFGTSQLGQFNEGPFPVGEILCPNCPLKTGIEVLSEKFGSM